MRLTRHTDFALRLLIHLSLSPGRRASAVEIARAFGISVDHLRKVVQELVSTGLVRTHRGRGGGVELVCDPDTLTVGDVVRRMEGPIQVMQCLSDPTDCRLTPACRLRRGLQKAQTAFMDVLDGLTIAGCTDSAEEARRLLGIPFARMTAAQ